MSWDKMTGDNQVRFCEQCQRQVWNFFEMTEAEIVEVMRTNPERLCAQIKKTKDGILVTKDYRPAQKKFRFSMLAMMALATCLSPLIFVAPGLYRWLVPNHDSLLPVHSMEREGGMVARSYFKHSESEGLQREKFD